jgi:glutaminyl-tRNA synthetase
VSGWDDPRLGTIAAYRRRGVPPEALRLLAQLVGVSRAPARTEEAKLDFAIREVLNPVAPRVMAVLDPLKVVITNWPEGRTEEIDAPYFPHDVPREGSRPLPFSREVWIERSDFAENPPKGFRRLVAGGLVRLRHAYVIRCEEVVKDQGGTVVELRCTYDPATKSGGEGTAKGSGSKVKGTIHWVSAQHALPAEVRLFGRLMLDGDQAADGDVDLAATAARLNPESLTVLSGARVEPSVATDPPDTRYQFERNGYFWRDPVDGVADRLVFNRIVSLKDTWARREAEAATAPAMTSALAGSGDRHPRDPLPDRARRRRGARRLRGERAELLRVGARGPRRCAGRGGLDRR